MTTVAAHAPLTAVVTPAVAAPTAYAPFAATPLAPVATPAPATASSTGSVVGSGICCYQQGSAASVAPIVSPISSPQAYSSPIPISQYGEASRISSVAASVSSALQQVPPVPVAQSTPVPQMTPQAPSPLSSPQLSSVACLALPAKITSVPPRSTNVSPHPQAPMTSRSSTHELPTQPRIIEDWAGAETRERRPTDPFFYPTTTNPLTGHGIGLIEQTTPPPRVVAKPDGNASPGMPVMPAWTKRQEEPQPAMFVAPPMHSYMDKDEDRRILQHQNDDLARHIQALEHAKSLAAVQSAQALQKIRQRQDHIKREAEQACRKAREMQVDAGGLPPERRSPGYGSPGAPSELGDPLAFGGYPPPMPAATPPAMPPSTPLEGRGSAAQGSWAAESSWPEDASFGGAGRGMRSRMEDSGISGGHGTPLVGNAVSGSTGQLLGQPLTVRNSSQSVFEVVAMDTPSTTPAAQREDPCLLGDARSQLHDRTADAIRHAMQGRPAGGQGGCGEGSREMGLAALGSSLSAASASFHDDPAAQTRSVPLPADRVPPTDIAAMASCILSAHNAPGLSSMFGQTSDSVSAGVAHSGAGHTGASAGSRKQLMMEPYVDALGRPLGSVFMPDLPNIKDDPPESQANGWGTSRDRSASPLDAPGAAVILTTAASAAALSPAGATASDGIGPEHAAYADVGDGEFASQYAQEEAVPLSARRNPLPAHERGPVSARASQVAARQVSDRQGSVASASARGSSVGTGAAGGNSVDTPAAAASPAADAFASTAMPQGTPPMPQTSSRASLAGGAEAGGSMSSGARPSRVRQESSEPPRAQSRRRGAAVPDDEAQEAPTARAGSPGVRRRGSDEARSSSQSHPRGSVATKAPAAPDGVGYSALPEGISEELQAELEECLDTIRWSAGSVTRESMQDMKGIQKPAPLVKDVLEAVSLLLGQPDNKWDKLKRLFMSESFPVKLQRFNFQQAVTMEQFRKLGEILDNPDFDEELIKTICVPVVPLAVWCRAIGVYLSKTKFCGSMDIRSVAAAGATSPSAHRQVVVASPMPNDVYMVFDPDLDQLDAEELRQVPELTISRPNVGTITFHGETDCTGIDFERVVRLEIGEVLVYPESTVKCAVGVGLNKPATVTMYQCWPPSGSKLLQDPKSQERYKKKIKAMTEEKRARFIDYDCSTGVWKFAVEHF